jgi:hypothetical protein
MSRHIRLALGLVLAAAAIAYLATQADAKTLPSHWCRGGDPPIHASGYTSCPFAGNVLNAYYAAGLPRFWTGSASSPVTHRTYGMLCTRGRGWPSKVNCWTGKDVWLSFSAD